MKKYIYTLLFLAFFTDLSAQNRYLVYLTDKGASPSVNIEEVLSARAIKNHQKNKVVFNEYDFPVNPTYLNELNQLGQVVKTSKWLNAVVITSNHSIQTFTVLAFVKEVESLKTGQVLKNNKFLEEENLSHLKTLNYDSTYNQNIQIGVDCMHDKGFLGQNVLLAVLDAGFLGMDTIQAFDSLYLQNRVVDKFNFIDNDTTVYERSSHGTMVSSVIAGNQTNFIGSAPNVDLCLYITEDAAVEVREEEFDLVRGLERADSVGADLVNISLSYMVFDTLQGDYSYNDMDGETTVSAKGVQVATSKGLVIVCSAGNNGPDYIRTPCDADSVLCVGATDTNNVKANFSSVGPSADQRVKPDVSGVGRDSYVVDNNGNIRTANGTSFSSPLICGMTACLIQSHPTLTMLQVVEAVRQSAHQFSTPDSLLGYGIPNACKADSLLELLEPTVSVKEINKVANFDIYPNPTNGLVTIVNSDKIELVQVFSLTGKLVKENKLNHNTALLDCSELSSGTYIVKINHSLHQRLIKY
jgi:subtilisin family serine protease